MMQINNKLNALIVMRWYAEQPIAETPGLSGQTLTLQKLATCMLQQCGMIIMVLNTHTSAVWLL